MQGKFKVQDPEEISFTLTLTATLQEWRQVKAAFTPVEWNRQSRFINIINDVIKQAEHTYFPEEQIDGPQNDQTS